MLKVGLLGGTFDPVHNGHLQLALTAKKKCGLDKILFIPSAVPPHKNSSIICSVENRWNMLEAALEDCNYLELSDIEISSSGPSYTMNTIKMLRKQADKDTEYHFIIGHDAFLEIETWYHWEELVKIIDFIVAVRRGYPINDLVNLLERLSFTRSDHSQQVWRGIDDKNEIRVLASGIDDVSSSEIRTLISQEKQWQPLVPAPVAAYIERHGLYR